MAARNGLEPPAVVTRDPESDDSVENRTPPKKSVMFGKETFYVYDKRGIEHNSFGRCKEEQGHVRVGHGTSQLAQSAHRKKHEKRTPCVSNGGGRLSNSRGKLQKGVIKLRVRKSLDGADDPDDQRVRCETEVVIPASFFVGSPPVESILGSLEEVRPHSLLVALVLLSQGVLFLSPLHLMCITA